MKPLLIILFILYSVSFSFADTVPDSIYHERLFYLCKAWGLAKYHHTEIAAGNVNWDDELFTAIHGAKYSPTNEGFNDSLQCMLDNAGPMGIDSDPLPVVPDSLYIVGDFSWIQDDIFTDTVRSLLDTILARFRPQFNVYIQEGGGSPSFDYDQQYYLESDFPSEEKRLLALFRYWNIIDYFFPSKYLMDQDWDTTLVEFIPKIAGATDSLSFNLAFKELTARINDSHAYMYSPAYQSWDGIYYPPFFARYIENETVIVKVIPGITDISEGDVIKAIDGIDIYVLRDSLRQYSYGSNDVIIERQINSLILRGTSGNSQVVLDDGTRFDTVTFQRNSTNFTALNTDNSPIWRDTTINGACNFGIVDMGRLEVEDVEAMFDDLWETDAIIFDIRAYPNETLWTIVNYLFQSHIHIANFTVLDNAFPGTMYWIYATAGSGIAYPYSGNILLLFDERTLSQAEYTCMGLEQFPGALKIGSTTAGADGNVSKIYLPGKIYTYFTGMGTYYPDFTQTQRVGIIPDYEVHPTIEGIRAGMDEVLAFALDCSLLDIDQPGVTENIKLYPNPCQDKIYYALPGQDHKLVHFEIIDIYGRAVASFEKYSNKGAISLSGIAGGAYLLKISTGQEVIVQKILKQ